MSASREATNGIGQPVRRKEDFRLLIAKVCFSSNSDRMADIRAGPGCAISGLMQCSKRRAAGSPVAPNASVSDVASSGA